MLRREQEEPPFGKPFKQLSKVDFLEDILLLVFRMLIFYLIYPYLEASLYIVHGYVHQILSQLSQIEADFVFCFLAD